jgi:hypothetical protein
MVVAKTAAWLTELGPTDSAAYFAPADGTHLNAQGALAVAGRPASTRKRKMGRPWTSPWMPRLTAWIWALLSTVWLPQIAAEPVFARPTTAMLDAGCC